MLDQSEGIMNHYRSRCLQIILCAAVVLPLPGTSLTATNKLSQATWGTYSYRDHKGPGTYAYGYEVEDPVTGNVQFRQEERYADGTIIGSYGYVAPDGRPQVTRYVSDANGYRVLLDDRAHVFATPSRVEEPPWYQPPSYYGGQQESFEVAVLSQGSHAVRNPPPLIFIA